MDINVSRNEMKKEEYECELYGYTTEEAITELKDILSSAIKDQTDSMEQALMKHYKEPEEQSALKKATDCFRSKCAASVAEGMPQLENIVHEMFSIPDHVLLPEDSVQCQQYTEEDEKLLDAATEQLISRARKAVFLQTSLKGELHDLKKIMSAEAKIKEQQRVHDHRNQMLVEAVKHCDDMVSAVMEIKDNAEKLELLGNGVDLTQEKFVCL